MRLAGGLAVASLVALAACSGRSGYTPLSNDPGDDDPGEPRVVRDAGATTDASRDAAEPDATDVADSATEPQDAEVEAAAPPVDDEAGVPSP